MNTEYVVNFQHPSINKVPAINGISINGNPGEVFISGAGRLRMRLRDGIIMRIPNKGLSDKKAGMFDLIAYVGTAYQVNLDISLSKKQDARYRTFHNGDLIQDADGDVYMLAHQLTKYVKISGHGPNQTYAAYPAHMIIPTIVFGRATLTNT